MPGSPPPPDFPAPAAPSVPGVSIGSGVGVDASAGFSPSPTGAQLCGFGLPVFHANLGFHLPSFPPFPFPPTFSYFLGLNCDLSHPIDASFAYGGGRVPNLPPGDPEDVDE